VGVFGVGRFLMTLSIKSHIALKGFDTPPDLAKVIFLLAFPSALFTFFNSHGSVGRLRL